MNKNKIRIFMPARNEAKYINETITSLRNQTFTNFDLVISNNYSTDNTQHIIDNHAKQDSRIISIMPSREMGAKDHFDFGKEWFDTNYHMYAGAHDLYNKDYLKKSIDSIEKNPAVVVSGTKCLHFTDDGKIFPIPSIDFNSNGLLPLEKICIYLQGTYYNNLAYGLFRTKLTSKASIPPVLGYDHLELCYHLLKGDVITCDEQLIYFRYPNTASDHKRQINSIGAKDGAEGWTDLMQAFHELLKNNFKDTNFHHGKKIIKSILLTHYSYMLDQFDITYQDGENIANQIFSN